MKKKLLSLALGAAGLSGWVASSAVLASEAVEVYGKFAATFQSVDAEVAGLSLGDQWEMVDNASRIGFKGSKALEDSGLEAFYNMEFGVDVDALSGPISGRNAYAGIKGGFGAVMAGRLDSPLKSSQGKVDLFNDLTSGAILKADISGVLTKSDLRANNALVYKSPKIIDALTATLAFVPGEGASDASSTTGEILDGPADSISASVVYDANGLYLALASDTNVGDMDAVRFTAGYTMAGLQLGLISESSKSVAPGSQSESGTLASVAYTLGADTFKLQAISSDIVYTGGTQVSLGVDHQLAKGTKLFAYYSMSEYDYLSSTVTYKSNALGVGLQHSF